jgi:hypothetical protein
VAELLQPLAGGGGVAEGGHQGPHLLPRNLRRLLAAAACLQQQGGMVGMV